MTSYSKINQLSPRIKKLVQTAQNLKFKVLDSELEALLIEAELINLHQPLFNILLKDDKSPIYILITKETFPRVIKIRKKELNKNKQKGTLLGPFPSSYKLDEVLTIARKIFPWCEKPNGNKPCFYYHIHLCPGACIKKIESDEYQKQIANLILFLKGKKKSVLSNLKKQIKQLASQQIFEQASTLKKQIELIEEVTNPRYKLKPNLVLPRLNSNIALYNLMQLKQVLKTYSVIAKENQLARIEGYDVSNTMGKSAAVSMVVFINGKPDKSQYRLFNIKSLDTPNDYQMLKEALARRQKHLEWGSPDLILVDGGKGQVNAVKSVWQGPELIIGIAKNPDRLIIDKQEIKLEENHPALKLIQQIRDESHRFAKKQHTRLALKKLVS